jgi:hypothetical protein
MPAARPWSLSALALVAANLLPILGVGLGGWSVGNILLVYWAESGVVGVYTIARMLRVGGVRSLGTAAFFTVHYGGFMAGHLAFLLVILGGLGPHMSHPWDSTALGTLLDREALLMLVALSASHGVSFVQNFLGGEEWRRTTATQEMFAPYPRIMLMHVAIIVGFGLAMMTGSAAGVLIVLVVLKTAVDLRGHWQERARRAGAGGGHSEDDS